MKIAVFSKAKFIANTLNQIDDATFEFMFFDNKYTLIDNISLYDICIYHIDNTLDEEFISELFNTNSKIKTLALSNIPNNYEGCRLLKFGFKSYLHSLSNKSILKSAIESVYNDIIYVYPELMGFLISQLDKLEHTNIDLEKASLKSKQDNIVNFDLLTPKELEVLKLLAMGMSNLNIAQKLDIAEITVKKHISSMFEKLNVKDRLSLALTYKSFLE